MHSHWDRPQSRLLFPRSVPIRISMVLLERQSPRALSIAIISQSVPYPVTSDADV
ncbi:hypothetical protein QP185_18270 [Sphingomonas aerolata]|uniref:hypothetical protein n=1 Tax=Sphingomonas aerolata TaxID=185951 RepID=UPI002FE01A06